MIMEGMQVCVQSPARPGKRKQYDGFEELYALPAKRQECAALYDSDCPMGDASYPTPPFEFPMPALLPHDGIQSAQVVPQPPHVMQHALEQALHQAVEHNEIERQQRQQQQQQQQQQAQYSAPAYAQRKITESDFPDVSMMSMRPRSVYQETPRNRFADANNENALSMDFTLMKHVNRTSKSPGTFSLGFRANCPRCLRREPGHSAHILDERGNAL